MDENFDLFLEDCGPAFGKQAVPPLSIDRYRGKLPDQLLTYWQEYGWCGYADGLFWTVNPQEYEPVVEAWLGDTPLMEQDAYHIIARGAFGALYFWGEQSGHSLKIFAPGAYAIPKSPSVASLDRAMQLFFGIRDRKENDFDDLFAPALKKLGQLKSNEMYGFVPALALGGPSTLEHLQKVKAVEHLMLLAQLEPLRVMDSPTL